MRIIKNIRKKEAKIWQGKKCPVMKKFGEGDFLGCLFLEDGLIQDIRHWPGPGFFFSLVTRPPQSPFLKKI
jgi:hypothetical protein